MTFPRCAGRSYAALQAHGYPASDWTRKHALGLCRTGLVEAKNRKDHSERQGAVAMVIEFTWLFKECGGCNRCEASYKT